MDGGLAFVGSDEELCGVVGPIEPEQLFAKVPDGTEIFWVQGRRRLRNYVGANSSLFCKELHGPPRVFISTAVFSIR